MTLETLLGLDLLKRTAVSDLQVYGCQGDHGIPSLFRNDLSPVRWKHMQ